jgi:hypothetical protein
MFELHGYEFELHGVWWVAYRVMESMDMPGIPPEEQWGRVGVKRSPSLPGLLAEVRKDCVVKLAKGQIKILLLQWDRALEAIQAEAQCLESEMRHEQDETDW